MAWRTKLSLLGLYNWDSTIFDGLKLPSELNKEELVNNLLMELAELTVLYTDSDFMKKAITSWSTIRYHTWERMAKVLYEDYEPFINIKRDEVRTILQERDLRGTGENNTSTKVNAWETEIPQDSTSSNSDSSTTDTGTVKTTETFHVEGDSAITDAQDVLKKELDVRLQYDMYRIIIEEFKQRFCLLIY